MPGDEIDYFVRIRQTGDMNDERPKRRRRFQFGLRTLLIAVLVLSLPLGWLGHRLQRARSQKNALARLQAIGGTYFYDWEPEFVVAGDECGPPQPWWLIKLVGCDFFWDVTKIKTYKNEIVDEDLTILREFPKTESLSLHSCQIGDEGILHLANLCDLRTLYLTNTHITDDGLEVLGNMVRLTELDLAGTSITGNGCTHLSEIATLSYLNLAISDVNDNGMKHIKDLRHLESLSLIDTRISDQGLECLRGHGHLTLLSIDRCEMVTDAGLAHVAEISGLQELGLSSTSITDDGLRHISQLGSLKTLNLSGTRVTDDGLRHLFGLDLRKLDLSETNVTPEGMDRAERAMPNCYVLPLKGERGSLEELVEELGSDPFALE